MKLAKYIAVGFLALSTHSAFAMIEDFDEATQNMTAVPVVSKQCKLHLSDKVNGLVLDTDELDPIADHDRPNSKYLSYWKFHLGNDDSNLLATVSPYKDKSGNLLVHVLIENEPGDFQKSGREETVELTGQQTAADQISFHGWSDNKFDFSSAGKQFDTNTALKNGKFELAGETVELRYNLNCQF
jgi:hypothetical protein